MQQPGPCICMTPVPSRASSLPVSMQPLARCLPGGGELRVLKWVDKYIGTAISSDFWIDCRLHHQSHRRRQGKCLQDATGAKKRRLHLAKKSSWQQCFNELWPHCLSIPCSKLCHCCYQEWGGKQFSRAYSRQHHKPLSKHIQPEDPNPNFDVTNTCNTQPTPRTMLCQQPARK